MERPSFIMRPSEMAQRPMRIVRTGELLGLVAMISDRAGLTQIRVQYEVLPPGRRSSSPHAHTASEELIYVLDGSPEAWIDGHLYPLREGDCVAFAAGTGIAHTLINNSTSDAKLLVVATLPAEDRCHYPLNPDPGDAPAEIAAAWSARPRGPHDGRPGRGGRCVGG
jgi:uncharacterized cupin superfamily protein